MVSRETGGKAAFILFCKFLIGKELHYNVLISAIQQCESLISIHMSPPSWTSFPPSAPSHFSRMLQSTRLSSMCYTSNFPLPVLQLVVCTSQSSSPILPTPLSSGNHLFVLCIYESVFILRWFVLVFWFDIQVKTNSICLSQSSLFHWAKYPPGPSVLSE